MKRIILGILALLLFSITNAQIGTNNADYTPVETSNLLQIDPPMIQLEEVLIVAETNRTHICKTRCSFSVISCSAEGTEISNTKDPMRYMATEHTVLYPNSSPTGLFNLKTRENYDNLELLIFTMNGQLIQANNYSHNSNEILIDLSGYSAGMYLIRVIENGNLLETIRAIKS